MTSVRQQPKSDRSLGSLDGEGAGDHDQPYRFGWQPRSSVPYPFSARQYARLLVFRGRVQDHLEGGTASDGISWPPAAA